MIARTTTLLALAIAALGLTGCGGIGNAQVELRSAIDAKQSTLDDCYASALKRDATIRGDVTMWLHVSKDNGTVSKIEIGQSAINDVELLRCVERTIVGTKLPKAPGANMKVEYRIQMSPKTGAVAYRL